MKPTRKVLGGAEKARKRKQQELLREGSKAKLKITEIFKQQTPDESEDTNRHTISSDDPSITTDDHQIPKTINETTEIFKQQSPDPDQSEDIHTISSDDTSMAILMATDDYPIPKTNNGKTVTFKQHTPNPDQSGDMNKLTITSDDPSMTIIATDDNPIPKTNDNNTITDSSFDYFSKPKKSELTAFFKYHPRQPTDGIPFNPEKAYKQVSCIQRKWLTYSTEKNALFCSVCLAYSKVSDYSTFTSGMSDWKHTYQRISEHENSAGHKSCAEAYLMSVRGTSIYSEVQTMRNKQVIERRKVLERVIDVIMLIGKRGLSYRGHRNEAAHTLDDLYLDHGNFLDILLLLSKYDTLLQNHLNNVINKSKKRLENADGSKGRGSLVTLISKTTINFIIEEIKKLIQEAIVNEVHSAKVYSVQIDTTQDISVTDQCSIILRYVTDEVHEHLFSFVESHSGKGKDMFELLVDILTSNGLDISKCISNSTDGAANMSGKYNGFTAWLEKSDPLHLHVWCHAHVLNLVMSETTTVNTASVSLFGLLNACSVFFGESYIRMDIFKNQLLSGSKKLKRLQTIGATRWWSKDKCLRGIFGSFASNNIASDCLYFELLMALYQISTSTKSNAKTKYEADGMLKSFLKFETIVTAQTYLKLFLYTTPLSEYLQTSGLDYIQAYRMVDSTITTLKSISRNFEEILDSATNFSRRVNEQIEETELDFPYMAETELPTERLRRKKQMIGEMSRDEPIECPRTKYRVEVFNVIMDTAIQSMEQRFSKHKDLYNEIALFDPRNFKDIEITQKRLNKIYSIMQKQFPEICNSIDDLKDELLVFAKQWDKLRNTIADEFKNDNGEEEFYNDEDDTDMISGCKKNCRNCIACAFQVLTRFNLFSRSFVNLYFAYKTLLTMSVTQVACERTFSKLKVVKTKCRSLLTMEHLEAFMLMYVEKNILASISIEKLIDKIATKSNEMKRLLL